MAFRVLIRAENSCDSVQPLQISYIRPEHNDENESSDTTTPMTTTTIENITWKNKSSNNREAKGK